MRYSLLPEGAPSLETTSRSLGSRPNILDINSAGFANVALHEIKWMRLSRLKTQVKYSRLFLVI